MGCASCNGGSVYKRAVFTLLLERVRKLGLIFKILKLYFEHRDHFIYLIVSDIDTNIFRL